MITDFRSEILHVLKQKSNAIQPLWGMRSGRTHVFLGSRPGHLPPARIKFNQYGTGGLDACVLTEVYGQSYTHMQQAVPTAPDQGREHPFYELYRVDCTYFAYGRIGDTIGYPVDWEVDWLIEVENERNEFTMHMRGLLDFVCNHRLGIFFADPPDAAKLTKEFLVSWQPFAKKYSFAKDLDLQAVFFPETWNDGRWDDFANSSRLFVWDAATCSFR